MKHHSPLILLIMLHLILQGVLMRTFAQKNGEITFSNRMINPSDPSGMITEFKAGDPIYGMAFFDKSFAAAVGKASASKIPVEVFIYELKAPLYDYQEPSEMQLITGTLTVSGAALQKNYLPVDIVPAGDQVTAYGNPDLAYKKFGPKFDGPVKFAERLSQLEAGEHEIIVKLNANYEFFAEGRFKIKGDNYAAYQGMAETLNQSADNIKSQGTTMPKSARSDKPLEGEMIAAFKASQTYRDRVKGEVLRVVIIDPDWMIRRNQLTGVILHRYIRAAIAVKNSDGSCTLWQNVTFQQDYYGDKFQATKFDGIGDPLKLPCENVQK